MINSTVCVCVFTSLFGEESSCLAASGDSAGTANVYKLIVISPFLNTFANHSVSRVFTILFYTQEIDSSEVENVELNFFIQGFEVEDLSNTEATFNETCSKSVFSKKGSFKRKIFDLFLHTE